MRSRSEAVYFAFGLARKQVGGQIDKKGGIPAFMGCKQLVVAENLGNIRDMKFKITTIYWSAA
jgi:hypothetical protein